MNVMPRAVNAKNVHNLRLHLINGMFFLSLLFVVVVFQFFFFIPKRRGGAGKKVKIFLVIAIYCNEWKIMPTFVILHGPFKRCTFL